MELLYHASQVKDIKVLKPMTSNHGVPRVYFSGKRENVLVYLSNAVEKYCRETGFEYQGIWHKWASYGFDEDGRLRLEEYYPGALYDTYKGISGYLYAVEKGNYAEALEGVREAYVSSVPVRVHSCERIEDAYEAIMEAERRKLISVLRYEEFSEKGLEWIRRTVRQEYRENEGHPEYRYFLEKHFDIGNEV